MCQLQRNNHGFDAISSSGPGWTTSGNFVQFGEQVRPYAVVVFKRLSERYPEVITICNFNRFLVLDWSSKPKALKETLLCKYVHLELLSPLGPSGDVRCLQVLTDTPRYPQMLPYAPICSRMLPDASRWSHRAHFLCEFDFAIISCV